MTREQTRWRAFAERVTLGTVAAVGALALFVGLAHEMGEGATRRLDSQAVQFFRVHQSAGLHNLMTAITLLGSGDGVFLVLGVSVLAFWRAGRFRPAGASLLPAIVGGEGLVYGLKALFHRARPDPIYAHLGYSFPSGHSFLALTLYGALAYWLTRDAAPRRRWGVWSAAIGLILLVGFSRVCLGVHYPSDVLAGFAAALPWLWGCLALHGKYKPTEEHT